MALKPNRIITPEGSRIKFFMNETSEAGVVVIYDTDGGDGFDNADSAVVLPTGTNGVPAGVLMCDVVDVDLSRYHGNWHKDEVQLGNKVHTIRSGFIKTDQLNSGDEPVAGTAAYYKADGVFTTGTGSTRVGTFQGPPDSEGYVEVEINIS